MVKLIGYLIGGFSSLFSLIVAFIGRKAVVASACITAMVALTATLIVCLKAMVVTIVSWMVLPAWLASIAWFVPPHMVALFSLIVSGRTCRAAYDITIEKLKLINSSS